MKLINVPKGKNEFIKNINLGRTFKLLTLVLLMFISIVAKSQNTGFDINDDRYNIFGQTLVKTHEELSLPPVGILTTERGDKTISLLINENIHKNFYSSYYIERSTDGVNFTTLNDEPYFFVGPDKDDISNLDPNSAENLEIADIRSAVYIDSVADYNIYYYRIIGVNNLGQMSEPSSIVSEKALKPKLDITFYLDTILYDPSSDDATIFFPEYHDSIKSSLIGYQLYKSVFHDGPFDPLNDEIIPTTTPSFTDIDPLLSGYYIAVSWDEEGHEYRTYSYLLQLPDDTAPPVPVMTEARYIENEKVRISWDEVFASDLKGYYIYFANGENGEYNPVNSSPHEDTVLVHDFNVGMEIDSIYFKVAAIDNRGNISNTSASLGIRRPGKYGASNPIIHSITPYTAGDKGMVLAFSFSPDNDIKYHKLERRSASNATWMEVLRIFSHEQSEYIEGPDQMTYIDSTYIRNESMEYRLLVTDQDDMVTGSEVVEAFPINSLPDGYINQFQLEQNSNSTPLPPLPPFQSAIANQLPASSQVNHSITLSWVYDNNPRLQGFTIYRGITGGHMIEYRNIPKKDLEQEAIGGEKYRFYFKDSSLIGNKRYIYKVIAQHYDGSTSHMSNAISVKID